MSEAELFEPSEGLESESALKELARLCQKQLSIEALITSLSDQLSDAKKEWEQVSRTLIPSILNEAGLSELRLSTGEKIIIRDKLQVSIPDKNYLQAYRNMINAEGGTDEAVKKVDSLFKSQVVIEGEVSDEVLDFLLEKEVPYETKKSIHHQTLNKYCRDRLESGKLIPIGISVFEYQETKIEK